MSDEEGLTGEDGATLDARAAKGAANACEILVLRVRERIPGEECSNALGARADVLDGEEAPENWHLALLREPGGGGADRAPGS